MSTHARLSASSAERFMECPGSVRLSELLGLESAESIYAAEGTAAHALAERCLREETDAFMFIGEELYTFSDEDGDDIFTATAEMADYVQSYVDYVREMAGDRVIHVEERLENEELGSDVGGTSDAFINGLTNPDASGNRGFIHNFDFKYGAGVPVPAEQNAQQMYYMFLLLLKYGVKRGEKVSCGITIHQPRIATDDEGAVSEWWTDSDTILAWGYDELLPAIKNVNTEGSEFVCGTHCQWCPAKSACPAIRADADELVEADPAPEGLAVMDNDTLAEYYDKFAHIRMFMKAVETEVKARLLAGKDVGEIKLGYGRATRKLKDGAEEELLAIFGDDAYTDPVLKSPTQLEKLPGGKEIVSKFVYKTEGAPIIAGPNYRGRLYKVEDEADVFASIKSS